MPQPAGAPTPEGASTTPRIPPVVTTTTFTSPSPCEATMIDDERIFDEESAMLEQLAGADAGFEEDLPRHLRRLSDGYGNRLRSLYPQGHLIDEVARSLVRAGFELHDCAARERTGGVCLTPSTADAGVIVTWTVHDALAFDQ